MACNTCNNKPYTITHALDLDIDDLATVPDYFIGIRTVEDPATGATIATPVRVPGKRVIPTGSLQNVVALSTNNPYLEIPEGQVRAGYMNTQPGGNVMRLADTTHPAQFLMVSNYPNGKMLVQTTGFLSIAVGHQYLVGQQYYTGADGMPTTDNASGQKLFVPLDEHTLNINGDF